jgi:hypothetical protein
MRQSPARERLLKNERDIIMRHQFIAGVLVLGLAAGCGSSTSRDTAPAPSENSAPKQVETKKKAPPAAPSEEALAAGEKKPDATPPKSKEPDSYKPPPGMTMEKADVGAGAKGHYDPGVIATPVSTYFRAQERIMFSIQIPEFMRAYKFEHDFKGPKSNEEYMEKIIKKNNVHLPDLPPGHSYYYDPKTEELMVIKPR